MMNDLLPELQVTLELVRQAGAEVLRLYASFEKIEDAPADISTEADRVSQELLLQGLHHEFPSDGLCGEETTETLQESDPNARRVWLVDPIDGTRGFARKNDEFSIMVGLVENGKILLGVVHEPAIDRITFAVFGQGCYSGQPFDTQVQRCSVSNTQGTPRVLSMSRSQGPEGEKHLLAAFGAERAVQTYSAGIKLAQVARGETDLYLGDYLTLHDWDVCAGHILVEEAGGRVTNIEGQPIIYDESGKSLRGKGILASNSFVHNAALSVLAAGKIDF